MTGSEILPQLFVAVRVGETRQPVKLNEVSKEPFPVWHLEEGSKIVK